MNITISLPHPHTYLYLVRFIVNITHQHDNNKTLQGIYCYECYLLGLTVIKSCMKLDKELHAFCKPNGLATLVFMLVC